MDLANLQAFVSVAELGSFSLAASHLRLTQPAVSKRIAALEGSLGTRLFDRLGRSITLTEAGTALLPRAHKLLLDMDDMRRRLTNLSGEVGGTLVLATSHHIGLHRLPGVLRDYTGRYPDVRLDLRFMDSEAGCQAVERGEIEVAIVTLPVAPGENLHLEPVWFDELHIVVPQTHALSGKNKVSAEALAQHDAILPAWGTFTRTIIEDAFTAADLQLRVTMATNYLETLKMLVSVGLGWSVLPATMLDATLHRLRVRGIQLNRTLGLVWHPGRTLSNAATAMLTTCRQHADRRPPKGDRFI